MTPADRSPVWTPPPETRHRRRAAACHSIADLRAAARRRLPRGVFDFIDGGAEDERTLGGNAGVFGELRFRPHPLVDVSAVDLATDVLGVSQPTPLVVGPTGASGFAWPNGDLAIARAAHAASMPFTLSTSASVSIEEIARGTEGRFWFQAYIFRKRDFTERLVGRAEAAGAEALMITVDLPVGGNRERDHRNDFSIPFRYTPRNVADFALHPGWVLETLRHGMPELANLEGFTASNDVSAVASSVGRNYDASFNWDDLARLRERWPRKLVVKGISRAEDALRLTRMGVDAVVVSNHGGRQLDSALPTLACLAPVALAVRGRAQVWLDGGIRRGSDIVKARALGADAVLLGRATLMGAAVAGEAGATRAIDILRGELTRAMQLCGTPSFARIAPDIVAEQDLRRLFTHEVATRLLEDDPFGRGDPSTETHERRAS